MCSIQLTSLHLTASSYAADLVQQTARGNCGKIQICVQNVFVCAHQMSCLGLR